MKHEVCNSHSKVGQNLSVGPYFWEVINRLKILIFNTLKKGPFLADIQERFYEFVVAVWNYLWPSLGSYHQIQIVNIVCKSVKFVNSSEVVRCFSTLLGGLGSVQDWFSRSLLTVFQIRLIQNCFNLL